MRFFAVSEIIGFRAVYAFDAKFAFVAVKAVGAIAAAVYRVGIVAILVVVAHEDHVAVFVLLRAIRVVAVFVPRGEHGDFRHIQHQFVELFEKRTVEIEILAVCERIPFVRMPFVLVINFIWRIRRVNRNDLFTREVAFSVLEHAFIAPRKTPLHAACRTHCGFRQVDFCKELFFGFRNDELFLALGASFHGNTINHYVKKSIHRCGIEKYAGRF